MKLHTHQYFSLYKSDTDSGQSSFCSHFLWNYTVTTITIILVTLKLPTFILQNNGDKNCGPVVLLITEAQQQG